MRPYLKNNKSKKRGGSMAQVVVCLPSKFKVFSSNSSITKIKANQATKQKTPRNYDGIGTDSEQFIFFQKSLLKITVEFFLIQVGLLLLVTQL
jgi:hypothetical protein